MSRIGRAPGYAPMLRSRPTTLQILVRCRKETLGWVARSIRPTWLYERPTARPTSRRLRPAASRASLISEPAEASARTARRVPRSAARSFDAIDAVSRHAVHSGLCDAAPPLRRGRVGAWLDVHAMTICANKCSHIGPTVHHMTHAAIEARLDVRLVHGVHHRDTMTGLHVRYGHHMHMATWTSLRRARDRRARDLRALDLR